MLKIYSKIDKLFNEILKSNAKDPLWVNNKKNNSIPISNKYFLTILDDKNNDIKNFFDYINDDDRILEFPFEKENDIDYSFMIEQEQIYNINIIDSNLKEISINLDDFFSIAKESEGQIIFILDINYIINNFVISKNISPNHLIDFILWKLKNKVSEIYVLDLYLNIKNYKNMLFAQLESCLINHDYLKFNLDNNFVVYKDINDEVFDNVYWNLFYPEMKILEYIQNINSPYDDSNFQIVKINNKECFMTKINVSDIIGKNLLNLNNEPGIIIDPTDRLNIFL